MGTTASFWNQAQLTPQQSAYFNPPAPREVNPRALLESLADQARGAGGGMVDMSDPNYLAGQMGVPGFSDVLNQSGAMDIDTTFDAWLQNELRGINQQAGNQTAYARQRTSEGLRQLGRGQEAGLLGDIAAEPYSAAALDASSASSGRAEQMRNMAEFQKAGMVGQFANQDFANDLGRSGMVLGGLGFAAGQNQQQFNQNAAMMGMDANAMMQNWNIPFNMLQGELGTRLGVAGGIQNQENAIINSGVGSYFGYNQPVPQWGGAFDPITQWLMAQSMQPEQSDPWNLGLPTPWGSFSVGGS
jgi:hypothetical protein